LEKVVLSPLQKHIIRRSFGGITQHSDQIAQLFYARLFDAYPHLRTLFPAAMEVQGQKLMQMLAMCVIYLDNETQLGHTVAALGARHVEYGVRDEDYQAVGEALLWSISQVMGGSITPDIRDAWQTLYDLLAHMAINGARAHRDAAGK
jgi:hemoglobin-like flavoprotein